jgi:ABC-2 type transport system permease protein
VSDAIGSARILDRGYRPYEGRRLGPAHAVRSLAKHSVQRALGLKRPATSKILPALTVIIAYVPAIVFVGITVLFDDLLVTEPDVLPSYADYYGYIALAIILFTAFVAPELLSGDRRDRMLGLYLASPLTRTTYLLGKAIAVMATLALVTLGPPLFLLIAQTVAGNGPDGPADLLKLFGQIVVGGVVVAALPGALSLAVASFTTRRAAASAAISLILLGSATVSVTLLGTPNPPDSAFLLNLLSLPFQVVKRVYGEVGTADGARSLSTGVLVAAYLGWTVLFGAIAWLRYRRIEVTR